MEFEWTVTDTKYKTVKYFLKEKGISKRLLAKLKFQGGEIKVNGEDSRVRRTLEKNDRVSVTLPKEEGNIHLEVSHEPLNILYEDEHFLFVNKPAGIASVPSPERRNHTISNRVKGYILSKGYLHQTIHVVNRLDRDTSGVIIFAKHTLAHSYLDRLLRRNELEREYLVYVEGKVEKDHGLINEPIGREKGSIIKRTVDSGGKPSLTEYWVKERFKRATELQVILHTGRTHQIRVHFHYLGHALIGESLYKEVKHPPLISRQALHCQKVQFIHPFSHTPVVIEAPLPEDLRGLRNQLLEE
ncbi:RluA family pseudouridine synthase [Alkalibacterium iburiense]|uniref:Pseudouridine synthase n=1 Tax=Alkalibacterium iburiense TaxID=290589 RepID=A0ABN0X4U4_9LACT